MDGAVASRVYDFYGRFYDVFEGIFKRRLARAISAIPFSGGDRVLDVGVGTGISLSFYPPQVHVTGIDLSEEMLRQAQRKIDRGRARASAPASATRLLRGDALNLPFSAEAFDVVFLSHVISTVADPGRCLFEAARVTRDRGLVVIVNHFRSGLPVVNWVESAIDPICRRLGWRTDLSLEELIGEPNGKGARRRGGRGLFRTVFLRKSHGSLQRMESSEGAACRAALDTPGI